MCRRHLVVERRSILMSKNIFCSNLIHPPFGASLLQSVVNYLFIFSDLGSDGIGLFLICVLTVGSICHKKTLNNKYYCVTGQTSKGN